jgi:hypothetical protein
VLASIANEASVAEELFMFVFTNYESSNFDYHV